MMKKLKKAYLEITNVCNLACSFCPGTSREKRFMSLGEFDVLSSRLRPHTDYLYLHLMGEPLLHPELPAILSSAAGQGFKVIITTNGTLLDRRGELLLASPAVHKINISLQSFEANAGHEPESYVALCARFAAMVSQCGKICVLRLWNDGGENSLNDKIRAALAACFPQPWEEGRGGERLSERVWLERGERFDWPDLNAQLENEPSFCYGLRDQVGVLADGTVVPCCLDHEGDIALGNLFEQSMEEILSSPRAAALYEGFSRRRAMEELCRKCGYAGRFS